MKLRLATAILALTATAALAENPMVGGAPMLEDKTIVENAVNSADHTTLVAAVQAAGLVETLSGAGPFTVFAPSRMMVASPSQVMPALLPSNVPPPLMLASFSMTVAPSAMLIFTLLPSVPVNTSPFFTW